MTATDARLAATLDQLERAREELATLRKFRADVQALLMLDCAIHPDVLRHLMPARRQA